MSAGGKKIEEFLANYSAIHLGIQVVGNGDGSRHVFTKKHRIIALNNPTLQGFYRIAGVRESVVLPRLPV